MEVLLSTAYWPNLQYMFYVLNAEKVQLEQHEHYGKQSYRNRCGILSANGPLNLSIPIKKSQSKELVRDVEISYKENWKAKHWRAIQSAYNNSPYFEYFELDFKHFYKKEYSHLFDYNLEQLHFLLRLFRVEKKIELSPGFQKTIEQIDLREKIDPKIDFRTDPQVSQVLSKEYYQTFDTKFEFVPNLSILDLLFNKGLESLDYLHFKPKTNISVSENK